MFKKYHILEWNELIFVFCYELSVQDALELVYIVVPIL